MKDKIPLSDDQFFWKKSTINVISKVENYFEKEIGNYKQRIKEINNGDLDINATKVLVSECKNNIKEIVDFNELFRKSLVMSIYSYLECFLKIRCLELSNTNNSKIKPDDLKGGEIDKFVKYIDFAESVDLKNQHKNSWKKIKMIQLIRNKIVHSNGLIDLKYDQEIIGFLKGDGSKLIRINNNKIFINKYFLFQEVRWIYKFLREYLSITTEKPF